MVADASMYVNSSSCAVGCCGECKSEADHVQVLYNQERRPGSQLPQPSCSPSASAWGSANRAKHLAERPNSGTSRATPCLAQPSSTFTRNVVGALSFSEDESALPW